MTNLRVVWSCRSNRRTNLSIGLDCITSIEVKPAASRLRGRLVGRLVGWLLAVCGCGVGRQNFDLSFNQPSFLA